MDNSYLDGVTIVMPALNEEKNIGQSIEMVEEVFKRLELNYELIIINDGSTDATSKIIEIFKNKNKNIISIDHKISIGMGGCFKEALKIAKKKYFMHIVSKNECTADSIEKIINLRTKYSIVIPYTSNMHEREFSRKVLSKCFTKILNLITGFNLKYYNGTVLYKTDLIRSIDFSAKYHTFQAEALIKLLKLKNSFVEVPVLVNWNKLHKSNAFKIENIKSVIFFLIKLIFKKNIY